MAKATVAEYDFVGVPVVTSNSYAAASSSFPGYLPTMFPRGTLSAFVKSKVVAGATNLVIPTLVRLRRLYRQSPGRGPLLHSVLNQPTRKFQPRIALGLAFKTVHVASGTAPFFPDRDDLDGSLST
jgi:hypothetical protein